MEQKPCLSADDQRTSHLTGLLLPLADRHLILPNVAVAELIDYQPAASTRHAALVSGASTVAQAANSAAQFRVGVRQ
jgi:hypothetical protein